MLKYKNKIQNEMKYLIIININNLIIINIIYNKL